MKMLNAIILGVATTVLLLFAAPPAQAVIFNLSATPGTVTMPDGATVPVWGLVEGANLPFAPVPVLTATAGDTLLINLTNLTPEPVSLAINGQPSTDPNAPVFFNDGNGRQRVRSFTHEVAPRALPTDPPNTAGYNWGSLRPGTYLITSASHPSVQVPMGLYAVLKVDTVPKVGAAAGESYSGVPFDEEMTLLFSELDPALNQAVADGIYGDPLGAYPTALKVGYEPKYFLLNGQPWLAGSAPLAEVVPGNNVLLRMINAGLRPRMPVFPGQAMTMLAEDGNLTDFRPLQVSADLVAGKTIDALWTVPAAANNRYLPIHDRMLGLTGGGMLASLAVGTPNVALAVTTTGPGSVSAISLAGGIAGCSAGGGLCSGNYLPGTALTLQAAPSGPDNALLSWSVALTTDGSSTGECSVIGDCVITLDQDKTVTANFANFATTTLISPTGGEQIPLDTIYPIRWAAPAGEFTFDLGFSAGPGAPFRLIADRVSGREFLWNLATAGLRPSASARLGIISYDAAGNIVGRDTSDAAFALVSPLAITAPNGGENITTGAAFTITWSVRPTTPTTGRASLWYQPDAATEWSLIAEVDPALGNYAWTAPTTPSSAARVAMTIYDVAGSPIASDTSDATFSIVAPAAAASAGPAATQQLPIPGASSNTVVTSSLQNKGFAPLAAGSVQPAVASEQPAELVLLLPNGGEVLPRELSFTVLWQASAEAVSFALDYSLDGGQNWLKLARELNDTQFDWTIDPEIISSQSVLLRVSAFDDKGQVLNRDLSDEVFTID